MNEICTIWWKIMGNFAHKNIEQQNARWQSTKLVIYNVNTCIDCYE